MMKHTLLILSFILISACSAIPASNSNTLVSSKAVNLSEQSLHEQLMFFYFQWKSTPHVWGGTSQKGVDCSGLVLRAYQNVHQISVPRSTEYQSQSGLIVEESDRQVGDLVFFKTGFKQLHVGIYLGNKEFLHASSSKGVMISKLNNPYWKEVYWHTRRLVYL